MALVPVSLVGPPDMAIDPPAFLEGIVAGEDDIRKAHVRVMTFSELAGADDSRAAAAGRLACGRRARCWSTGVLDNKNILHDNIHA